MESNFTFTGEFSGPAVAAVLTVEMILGLITNGTVLFITLYQRKSWKQSSTIFFTSLILSHIVLNLQLSFSIIALAAGGWIFGSTDEEKTWTCIFAAWLLWSALAVLSFTLVALSFDRFLFIVKPHLHKRFMIPRVSLTITIVIWIAAVILNLWPILHNFEHYGYLNDLGGCSIVGVDIAAFVVFLVSNFLVFGSITITSLWTFCFTRSYFKAQSVIAGESVYASKKKRLIGIFGCMLIVYGLFYLQSVVSFFLQLFIVVPNEFFLALFLTFSFVTIASPIIQSYFRPEIKSVLVSCCPLLFTCVCCSCVHAV
uniref:G-protein coupled receptors family 1 profile domain-containing protein n=1 Tax=Amphimedon queenslandica TaxID=400682 RepID=A0A1X7TUL2_AMPQE